MFIVPALICQFVDHEVEFLRCRAFEIFELVHQGLGQLFVEFGKQGRLVGEMQEKSRLGHIRAFADVADGDGVVILFREQAHGRFIDLAAGALFLPLSAVGVLPLTA